MKDQKSQKAQHSHISQGDLS